MSLSEYAKLRKRLQSEDSKDSTEKTKDAEIIDKESSKEIETVMETADTASKTVSEELKVDKFEPSTAAAATTAVAATAAAAVATTAVVATAVAATTAVAADRKLSVESHEVQELTKQRNKSGGPAEYSRFSLLTSISYPLKILQHFH